MFVKLLCINTADFNDIYGKVQFTIEEGSTVSALIDRQGVRLEYEPHHYSLHYRFEDIDKGFILALDEEAYNKIYHKANNCKMYFEDGAVFDLGDVIVKFQT